MKDKTLMVLLFIFCSFGLKAQDNFVGFWSNENKTQIIKIYKSDNLYYADLIYKKEKPLKEIGTRSILLEMKKRSGKFLEDGTYIDHDHNKAFKIELALRDSKNFVLSWFENGLKTHSNWHRVP